MIAGVKIDTLAQQILQRAQTKRDIIADTRKLQFTEEGNISLTVGNEGRLIQPTKLCINQVGERVGIPAKYLERMRTEAPKLLAQNVNHWFGSKPERRMLRTYQNLEDIVGRAFLSDKYRPLDNDELAERILPRLMQAGVEIKSCQLTDTRLYIQAVTSKVTGEIKVGDPVQAGVLISNSEVGCGRIKVEQLIYTLSCTNGAVMGTGIQRSHVGRTRGETELDEAVELFSDATRKADDKAFWMKVSDVVDAAMNQLKFDELLAKLRDTTKRNLKDDVGEVVEVVAGRFMLADTERKSVLNHLAKGGDLTQYGLFNAVTRTAEDAEDYDRAIELERIGGMIATATPDDIKVFAA